MAKIVPCLWFDDQAEEAAGFYVETFRAMGQEAHVEHITYYPEGGPRSEGMVMTVAFSLAGQEYLALNGGPQFSFTEAISLTIVCADQAEIDGFWARLTDGGREVKCGWLKDRFDLSWQVDSEKAQQLMRDATPEQAKRILAAIMGMVKIDIAAIERAYSGN